MESVLLKSRYVFTHVLILIGVKSEEECYFDPSNFQYNFHFVQELKLAT